MKNILVLGVGGNVSLGILKSLSNSKYDLKIIGSCVSEQSFGMYLCDDFIISPYASSSNFMEWLIKVCNDFEIDLILTGVEEIILNIQRDIVKFKQNTKTLFIATDYDKLLIGQNKFLTSKWLKESGCNFPDFTLLDNNEAVNKLIEKNGFPLIAKPIHGKGSQGIFKINNFQDLELVTDKELYVLQEYIGTEDSEYTVGCYVTREKRILKPIIMHRKLSNGTPVFSEILDNELIEQEVYKICEKFEPIGPLNIQLRLSNLGKPICFELNVRFSGTTPIRSHFGFTDVDALIGEYLFGENIDDFKFRKGVAIRYLNEVYVENSKFSKENVKLETYGFKL